MKRKHGLPQIHQLPGGVVPQECPVGEPLTPAFHMDMEINKDQRKEKSEGYLLGARYSKGTSYHNLRFSRDSKARRGVGKLFGGKSSASRIALTGSYGPSEALGGQLDVGCTM